MPPERIEFLSAILLVSKDPARLAAFYRNVVGVPLEDERHEGTQPHWGCTLGDVHFAIHPLEDFPEHPRAGVGAVKLAFTVFDVHALMQRLRSHGVTVLHEPRDEGYFISAAIEDPDGNFLEFTQLGEDWYSHLEQRRRQGHDVLAKRRQRRD